MGAHVIVTEVDPMRGARGGDGGLRGDADARARPRSATSSCTATGDKNVITREHMERMKDGAILANTGHFNVEIEIAALRDARGRDARGIREFVEEFTLADGRRLYLLGEGRLVNLAAAEGHPARGDGHVVREPGARRPSGSSRTPATLERKVYAVPDGDRRRDRAAQAATMGVEIDTLTEEQEKYLRSWDEGT